LPFEVVDRPQTLKLQRELGVDANPWRTHERIIASYHYLKQPDVLEQFRSAGEPGEDGRLRWDLLIVDEAHNLAPASFGADSDLAKMLQRIAPWFEHRVFLTATPHNGHTRAFSGLLESLDPVRFTRKSELDAEDRKRVGEAVIRRLKSEINTSYTALNEPPRFSERIVQALPALRFGAVERELLQAVRDLRKALRVVVRAAAPADRTAAAFATEVLQKRLLSGPWAFGQSWFTLLEGLNEESGTAEAVARATAASADDSDDDAEKESRHRHVGKVVGAWMRQWKDQVSAELAAVTGPVTALGLTRVPPGLDATSHQAAVAQRAPEVKADARFRSLLTLIDERLRQGQAWRGDERLVVFTEYLATLDYLRARLRRQYGEGEWLLTLYGGMNDAERDAVKRQFNNPKSGARLLIATDAAGEGLNLQRAARLMLHWDIPWNPGKMEQRNGRLDRHGQERDVEIFHFDSVDDASMQFLGKVLKKRSQTREDRVVTDEIFADAILAHFDTEEDAGLSESRLNRAIGGAKLANAAAADDLPDGVTMPGAADRARLDALKAELDLSPTTLRDTLETAMAVESSRPRLLPDGPGRDRLKVPVPTMWQALVEETLRSRDTGGALAVVFDPAHYVQTRSGRPVYIPEPDSRLLHLGDALYHRVMSTFARYRFTGGPKSGTRWTVRRGGLPEGCPGDIDALVLLTIEEMAVNELREPCHHWVRTLALPVRGGSLGPPLPHLPASAWAMGPSSAAPSTGDQSAARDIWGEVEDEVKQAVVAAQKGLTTKLRERMKQASKLVIETERRRFEKRRKELERAVSETHVNSIRRDADKLRAKLKQLSILDELDAAALKQLADYDAELSLRKSHYDQVLTRLAQEEERTMRLVLPPRYTLRGDARVYPLAIEIRLAGRGGAV
jgi:superfamily II DNA or RNA helicase